MVIKKDAGVISFFTVIFVSMLLMIMVLAFTRLMTKELRQATDFDLSARALSAAESGVDDAINSLGIALAAANGIVRDLPAHGIIFNSCQSKELDLELDIEYTCQLITAGPSNVEDELTIGETRDMDLGAVSGARKVRVSWHIPLDDSATGLDIFNGGAAPAIGENTSTWQSRNIPSLLRLNVISYGNVITDRTDINNYVTFSYPAKVAFPATPLTSSTGQAKCDILPTNSSDYSCVAVFNLPGSDNNDQFFVRLQSIYNSTHYKLEMLDASDNPIPLPDYLISVDVTGRSGDVFRRVRVNVPLRGDDSIKLLPRHTVVTDDQLCKNFDISKQTFSASSNTGCE